MSRLASLLALIIIVGGGYYYWQQSATTAQQPSTPTSTQITQLKARAFGILSSADGGALGDLHDERGLSGSGGIAAGPDKTVGITDDLSLIPIDPGRPFEPWIPTLYEYNYAGTLPALGQTISVLRRKNTLNTTNVDTSGLLQSLNGGLFNASSFQNLTIQSVQIAEDREYGYSFYISTVDGTVSINKNWQRWPQQDYQSPDKGVEIPPKAELIQLAATFVEQIGIDLTPYGEPQIDQQWRTYSDCDERNRCTRPPTTINVTYPLMIEGQTVYEEYGTPSELSISVDLATKHVSGVWGLSAQHYDSSEYATASSEKIQAAILRGGRWDQWYPTEGEVKNVQITLDTPTQILVKIWQWNEESNAKVELLVPALAFPVTDIPAGAEDWYDKKMVIIPLTAELLESSTPSFIMQEPIPLNPPVGSRETAG